MTVLPQGSALAAFGGSLAARFASREDRHTSERLADSGAPSHNVAGLLVFVEGQALVPGSSQGMTA